jgi:hypothetical protein
MNQFPSVLFAVSAQMIFLCSAAAGGVVVPSSVADFEARFERPDVPGTSFYPNDVDDLRPIHPSLGAGNINIPSDAPMLRVGGQRRHLENALFFFPLPRLQGDERVLSARLQFAQIRDVNDVMPRFDANLWVLGIYSDISPENDPLTLSRGPNPAAVAHPTVGTGLTTQTYFDGTDDLRAGLNTSVPRAKIADDFVRAEEHLGASATQFFSLHETSLAESRELAGYLNDLYKSADGVLEGSYLVVRLNPDRVPSEATSRFRFASSDFPDSTLWPKLTIDAGPAGGSEPPTPIALPPALWPSLIVFGTVVAIEEVRRRRRRPRLRRAAKSDQSCQ